MKLFHCERFALYGMDLEEVHVQIIKNGICNHLHRPVHDYHAYKDILKVEINSELAEPDNCED